MRTLGPGHCHSVNVLWLLLVSLFFHAYNTATVHTEFQTRVANGSLCFNPNVVTTSSLKAPRNGRQRDPRAARTRVPRPGSPSRSAHRGRPAGRRTRSPRRGRGGRAAAARARGRSGRPRSAPGSGPRRTARCCTR